MFPLGTLCPCPCPCLPAGKLPFEEAPQDDRQLADIHLALYNDVVVFDHATKLAYVIAWVSRRGVMMMLQQQLVMLQQQAAVG